MPPVIDHFSMEVPTGTTENSNLKVAGPSQAKFQSNGTADDASIMLIHVLMTHPSHEGQGIYVWVGRRMGTEDRLGYSHYKLTFMLFLTTGGLAGGVAKGDGGVWGPQGVTVAITVTNSDGSTAATNQPVTVE